MERKFDLSISGSRLRLRSRAADSGDWDWGPGNRAQGARLEHGLLLLDPLADEDFGADIILRVPARFSPDKRAQRRLQLPFALLDPAQCFLGSPTEELPLAPDLAPGDYTLFYEVCVGRDVFYVLTLLPGRCDSARALLRDGWGLGEGQLLQPGLF